MMDTYTGFWDAIVVSVDAPATSPAGSVQVRVPEIHGTAAEVPDAALPWAVPNFLFAGPMAGLMGTPPKNAMVHVLFKHGDKRYPMWIGGGWRTGEESTLYASAKQGLTPKGWLWVTPAGFALIFDELAKKVIVQTPTGFKIELDETAKKILLQTVAQNKIEIDDIAKKITAQTPTGFKIELDETGQSAAIQTPSGQGVTLNEATGEAQVKGNLKAVLTAVLMEVGVGASEAAVLGTTFAMLFNAHTHFYFPGPLAQAATLPPIIPMLPGVHLSLVTKLK